MLASGCGLIAYRLVELDTKQINLYIYTNLDLLLWSDLRLFPM